MEISNIKIKLHHKIICLRHLDADGDAYGSTMGLTQLIKDNFPQKQAFTDGKETFQEYKVHPTELLTSKRFDFKDLPEPQNSKEVSEPIYLKETEEFDSLRISGEINNWNWTNLHPSFNQDQIQNWEKSFTYLQIKDWINIGLRPADHQLAKYLKAKNLTPEEILNHHNLESLKTEFEQS